MGISFKLSKIGERFRPKSVPTFTAEEEAHKDVVNVPSQRKSFPYPYSVSARKFTEKANENKGIAEISGREVSFTLSLFPSGYTVGKPMEDESGRQPSIEIPKFLYPYDRASETVFSAIESGRLPGDILDDIPCKYVDGTLVCEVRDYRNCYSESERSRVASGDGIPIINRICLMMSLENVVKDIPAISKSNWTYGDMMEVESRILKALQPQLYLDPTPQLDRLSDDLVTTKLNLALRGMRRKRLRQVSEVSVFPANNIHLKKGCIDRIPEGSRLGDSGSLVQQPTHVNLSTQNNVSSTILPRRNNSFRPDGPHMDSLPVSSQSKYQIDDASPRNLKDHHSGALLNLSEASPGDHGMIPFSDIGAASIHGKRENSDGQSSPLTNKKSKLLHMGVEGNSQQAGTQPENIHGPDLHWKNTLMQQQSITRGILYTNNGLQKFSQQVFEGGLIQEGSVIPFSIGQQGLSYGLKEEPVETERLEKQELSRMQVGESDLARIESQQSRLQQRMPQQFMRSGFPQPLWNNFGQPLENNSRKEDSLQKRKFVQSPRLSAGGLPQSPLSSKSGEFSSGSIGPQFGGVVTSGLITSQKDKSAVTSVPSVGVGCNPSLTSSANESMQRQNQAQAAAKRRSNSLPKTPGISGVGSPASVSNMSVPINASSPVGNQPLADQIMLERFSKIEMVSMRCQLNSKKNKVDEYPIRKSNTFSSQKLLLQLSSDSSNENLNDETCKMPLSNSLVGGNMNFLKTRILNFLQTERVIQGNGVQYVPKARTRMIMSEKPNDAVAYCIGEIEEDEYLDGEDYLPTLPNTHSADLLAAQFCSLMERDGYHMEDRVQPKPVRTSNSSINQLNAPGIPSGSSVSEMQQFSGAFGQPHNDISKPSNSVDASINSMQNAQGPRMLPPGNAQALQISQVLMPGVSLPSIPQQPELPPALQQQPQPQQHSLMQQQHPQFQRSPMMLPANSMQHLNNIAQNTNMQIGAHMANKPSSIQLQMLQQQPLQPQQQQQQQQAQMQRKMMTGLGTGMSNIGNNMVGLGGLGNSGIGIGGVRGVGVTQMGPISNVGSMNQSPMNLNQASTLSNAIRSGTLTQAQAAFLKLKMAHNRSNILGNPQSNIGGIPGARQVHPGSAGLSMLGPTLNRASINQMQRTAMGAMGPPKLMPSVNPYMNQQQQLQLQQQQQQQQIQLQQQQQLQLQQQQLQLQQQQQMQQQQLQLKQETTSISPPPVSSPLSMGIAHQMTQPQQQLPPPQQTSPQQISQRTPISPQLSSGAIHTTSTGNQEACPASPQVSSQTLGSVGSITNSPMELQGVNKSNSINNT